MTDIGDEAGEQILQMLNPTQQNSAWNWTFRWTKGALDLLWANTVGRLMEARKGATAQNVQKEKAMIEEILSKQNDTIKEALKNGGVGKEFNFTDGAAQTITFDYTMFEEKQKENIYEACKTSLEKIGINSSAVDAPKNIEGVIEGIFLVTFEDKDAPKITEFIETWQAELDANPLLKEDRERIYAPSMNTVEASQQTMPIESVKEIAGFMQEENLAAGLDSQIEVSHTGEMLVEIPAGKEQEYIQNNQSILERMKEAEARDRITEQRRESNKLASRKGKQETWETKKQRIAESQRKEAQKVPKIKSRSNPKKAATSPTIGKK